MPGSVPSGLSAQSCGRENFRGRRKLASAAFCLVVIIFNQQGFGLGPKFAGSGVINLRVGWTCGYRRATGIRSLCRIGILPVHKSGRLFPKETGQAGSLSHYCWGAGLGGRQIVRAELWVGKAARGPCYWGRFLPGCNFFQ